jgi:prolyl-tRNA synthetase|tara:strand:- start:466 stop:1905 length:1440 start_codon:yes stop_codon:yes gene_type:complete
MKQNKDGLGVKKEENFSEWYQELIIKSELADYTNVSGCIVFRPHAYAIWEILQKFIDKEFKKIGVKNAYFPLLIPEDTLSKEEEHVKGFTPEVAWVTQTGNTKLAKKLAIRPTSETIIYESYSKWIRSWRDLPLKLNLWNNVVRWEFKHPVPFLRTREFLWNEGHHAYSDKKELEKDKDSILKIYSSFLKDHMALPSLLGKKTDKEKFAGAESTYSLELYLPNGKAIQGPDYHDDGQNFAKAYNIKFKDKNGKENFVYQSTYAITTRMLGIMFAIHSDNNGLVLPPKMAENQIVIIPIMFEKNKKILKQAKEIKKSFSKYNPILDDRLEITPGKKYHEWELKGIPLRIEIGPKDLEKKEVILARRDNGKKNPIKIKDLKKNIENELKSMQESLLKKAERLLESNIEKSDNFKDALKKIKDNKIVLVPLKNSKEVEDILKDKTQGVKTLNIPLKQPPIKNKKCIISNEQADYWVYIGKSY